MFEKLKPPFCENEVMKHWKYIDKVYVSIVCTTYNHVEYISDAIDSFLAQETNYRFEIIVHDDASDDGTPEIINEYQKKFPQIIRLIIQDENKYSKGGFRPLVYASQQALGEYIAVCEGDDFWILNNKLEKQLTTLLSDARISVIGTNSLVVNEKGIVVYPDRWVHKGGRLLMTQTVMFKNVGFDKLYQEYTMDIKNGDISLFLYFNYFGKVCLLDEISAAYRITESGVWSKKSKLKRLEMNVESYTRLAEWDRLAGDLNYREINSIKLRLSIELFCVNFFKGNVDIKLLQSVFRFCKKRKVSIYTNFIYILYQFCREITKLVKSIWKAESVKC